MKIVSSVFFLICLFVAFCFADIPVSTYSIVARDPTTGEMGVAVQSHYFSVGPIVPWAEAGVGAIATQSVVEISYGPMGLDLIRGGKTAPEALQALLEVDTHRDVRQVAMIDSSGNVAAHTGIKCIADAGHQTGSNYSVQANLMANPSVWPAMAKAFESNTGSLADRMLAALDAAQAAGGDIRGEQSAAILVVSGKRTGVWWKDRVLELRVEDHPHPLQELRRLLQLRKAYNHADRGDAYMTEKNLPAALQEYEMASKLAPENDELLFWFAQSLYKQDEKKSLELFGKVFQKDRRWVDLIDRLPAAELLPAEAVSKIKKVAPK